MSERCSTCQKWKWSFDAPHKCPPAWHAMEEGYHCEDDDPATVYAGSASEAVERYAEESDAYGEYEIVSGSPAVVRIRPVAGGDWQRFSVTGESVPEYSAREIPAAEACSANAGIASEEGSRLK